MARIIADRGRQRLDTHDGVGYYFIYEMDCGCEIRMPERVFMSGSRISGVNLRDRLARVADAHDCEVVVHHAPERYRREVRQRRFTGDPPITLIGMDVASGSDSTAWLANWQLLGTFRMDPLPGRLPGRPQTAPEQEVRRAAEHLRGLQVSGVVVDEQIGFRAPEPQKAPEKKPDPPRALTRWELLELD